MTEARSTAPEPVADSTGMAYLSTLPRRVVTVYVPLAVFQESAIAICAGVRVSAI